ncbi:MAG: NAD-dependent epimerase/dehydratase family protein [Firmicutes bacterium]|nr:NAD-dependent epimerase/dehydratase family protein [Bacillota bacterium]
MLKVFVTGASGCVGSYLVDLLAPDYELYLLVRNPGKLKFDPGKWPAVHIIRGDMDAIGEQAGLLAKMDYCIHVATAWGGEGTERINVDRAHQMFDLLNPARVKRIIYFSTASILGRGNQLLPEAGKYGTDYIKTKYKCYVHLPERKLYERIVTVFPTLVFGGDASHPFPHFGSDVAAIRRLSWLIGRLNVPVKFHFIHAQDIAKIVRYLMEQPEVKANYVMGNEPLTFGEFAKRLAHFFGHPARWQIKIQPQGILKLAKVLRVKMDDWSRFCAGYGDFVYKTVNCRSLGLDSNYDTVEKLLADWKEKKR